MRYPRPQYISRLLAVLLVLVFSSMAQAQATRTWVSGVGDDANPCSRTAPCKTFAGAISKTAAKGEINVLDPGGFGGVTITKSITISSEGFEAGVLVSGTNAIVVNAGIADVVILRGLDIEGLGTGLNGIRFLGGRALHVEDCTINNFTGKAIEFSPSAGTVTTAQLFVSDTTIRNNAGGGILIKPGTNVSAVGLIENTELRNNQFGLRVEDFSIITARNSNATDNSGAGFIAVSNPGATMLMLDGCVSRGNSNGVKADLQNAVVKIANCTFSGNVFGIGSGGGQVLSFGNNNNADSGNPTGSIGQE